MVIHEILWVSKEKSAPGRGGNKRDNMNKSNTRDTTHHTTHHTMRNTHIIRRTAIRIAEKLGLGLKPPAIISIPVHIDTPAIATLITPRCPDCWAIDHYIPCGE